MHSMSGSSIVGKYERELTYRLNAARANSWMVASCKEPFGIPSFSFIRVETLSTTEGTEDSEVEIGFRLRAPLLSMVLLFGQRPKEACAVTRVTHIPVAEPLHLDQHRIIVAVDEQVDDLQPVARCLAFRPQLVTRAAEKGREPGTAGDRERLVVHETDHQDF